MSIYLDSVSITGIGGIPNNVTLDLTAPLTLIYAPNGTGKTSAWNAMKALLTRGVTEDIVCQSPTSLAVELSGSLHANGVRYEARAEHGKVTLKNQYGETYTGVNALSILAPEVVTTGVQTRGGVLRERLISQIQGCRFLPAESLLYLIDNGDESAELRRKLFADLTGTSSVQTEIRETTKYRERLAGELTNIKRDFERIDEQLQEFGDGNANSVVDPMELALQAAQLVGLEKPQGTVQQAFASLRAFEASALAALTSKRAAWSDWKAVTTARPDLDLDLDVAKKAQLEASSLRDHAEIELSSLQRQASEGRLEALLDQRQRITGVMSELMILLEDGERSEDFGSAAITDLRRAIDEAGPAPAIDSKIDLLVHLESIRDRYRGAVAERQVAVDRLDVLGKEVPTSSSALQTEIAECQLDRQELEQRIVELMDGRASLRTMAEALVEASKSPVCPCCSYRWASVDDLMEAISLPPDGASNDELKGDLSNLDERLAQLKEAYHKARIWEEELRLLQSRVSDLNRFIADVDQSLHRVGLNPERMLQETGLSAELSEMTSLRRVRLVMDKLDSISPPMQFTGSLADALIELKLKDRSFSEEISFARNVQLNLEESVRLCKAELATRSDAVRRLGADAVELARLSHRRDEAIGRLRANGITNMDGVASILIEDEDRILKLGAFLTQLESSIDARSFMQVKTQIEGNRARLEARRELISAEVRRADSLLQLLADFEAGSGQRFFDRLGPAVATLFDHMQVNRVFKRIELQAVKDSFSLRGYLADDVSLDPKAHFSKGQCQDLALSMFLVRAASLGGTFFLDEPLAHLDDLNRTALLDCLRACVIGSIDSQAPVRLVVTTSNWSVARHLMQKFYSVPRDSGSLLKVIQLAGNVRSAVKQIAVYPTNTNDLVTH